MRGRLNLMQRMMLRFRELHPYSAVHVATLDGSLDEGRLEAVIASQLEAWGLTGLTLDGRRRRYEYLGGPARVHLERVAAGEHPERMLDAEIERQLNLPFPPGPRMKPFRFFVQPGDSDFRFGIVYDHFIAGGDGGEQVDHRIAARYLDARVPAGAAPALYPPTYRSLFARRPGLFLHTLLRLPDMAASVKRAYRAPLDTDTYNTFARIHLAPAESAALRQSARALGVTLNDVLIAALLGALAPYAPERLAAARRRELNVASIVNIRREFGATAQGAFGQFLAALRVAHTVPAGIEPGALARDVHAATERFKRGRLYMRAVVALALAALGWPLLSPLQRRQFFAKHSPAVAGVSLLSVAAPWRDRAVPLRGYLRAISTGPLTPLVLAPSLTDQAMDMGVTFRRGACAAEVVPAIAEQIRRFANLPSPSCSIIES
jgi:hypothetical protein